ncbi:DUF2637 domain-containing protein [Streptomyces sp. B1866]|uniref:DUF2637 domain-containing protein n=1 Tax=Streptomyces sp. B1866 TaxID=3075431 RepID=UPI00288D9F10|nr:DUF2637 domain-containing protein [Streptomyces sp. B1866]MDT3397728.1 DUF2637 domain-containing protein [Streptomyces sp. B1866]
MIAILGAAGFALSYDALRQMAVATHVRPALTYLFPVVIDGFIFYGVRALLVLRGAPLHARASAWLLFGTATIASVWANTQHALNLNRPGAVDLHLGDRAVTVLSAIAPLALAGATHLYIVIGRYGTTPANPATATSSATSARVPYDTDQHTGSPSRVPDGAQERVPLTAPPPPTTAVATPADEPADASRPDADAEGRQAAAQPERELNGAGESPGKGYGPTPQPSPGGRPPLASLDQLVAVISAAHPDPATLTRGSARKALTRAGIGAGTERLTEAITQVRQRAQADHHPEPD